MSESLTIAWINDFPVEWLPVVPPELRDSPRRHPATWAMVLLSELQKNPALKVHVIVLRHRIERGFTFEQNGTVFHVLKAPPWARLGTVFGLDTLLIGRACKRIRPDLVHAWGMEKGAGLIAHWLGYPYVLTIQGLYSWYRQKTRLSRYDRFIERLDRFALPRAPLVTTESAFAVRFLQERHPHLAVQQAEHAPNQAFFRVRRQPQIDPPHFISVGGLDHRKGTDVLFAGLNELARKRPLRLTVITGPNPAYIENLRQQVTPGFWEHVQFKHHLLPNAVADELGSPTMLLLPTRADTSPNAVKEAAVAGLPVVASEIGGIPDYITPEKNGLLCPPGDLKGFVQAVERALEHPQFGRGEVDGPTLEKVRRYLSPERMAENFLGAYRRVLETRSK